MFFLISIPEKSNFPIIHFSHNFLTLAIQILYLSTKKDKNYHNLPVFIQCTKYSFMVKYLTLVHLLYVAKGLVLWICGNNTSLHFFEHWNEAA